MRPNNRQRSRGGRNGGGGGGGNHNAHKQHHNHNPNRPPNRNQIFDSSGPDVRVRGNAHQVFDKYQALAREAVATGDRIMAGAYWQYADHDCRLSQTMGGFVPRNNQGWGDGEDGQQGNPQQQNGQPPQQGAPQNNGNGGNTGDNPNNGSANNAGNNGGGNGGYSQDERPSNRREPDNEPDVSSARTSTTRQSNRREPDNEPGLGGVAFLQNGRSAPSNADPAAEEQPDVPEFTPTNGRRG